MVGWLFKREATQSSIERTLISCDPLLALSFVVSAIRHPERYGTKESDGA